MNRSLRLLVVLVTVVGPIGCLKEADRADYPTATEEQLQGVVRTSLDNPTPTAAQIARREKSLEYLRSLGVPYLESLPVVEDETTIQPRSAAEIASRCVAVALCAVKGETGDHQFAQQLLGDFGASEHLSPQERIFMANPTPKDQELVDAAWGYEVVHVLLWSLGFVDELKPPNEVCDVPSEVAIIRESGIAGLSQEAVPRPLSEILDQADLYYHLHWSAIELRLQGKSSPQVDEEIVQERHRALNWLIRYLGQDWDDITTDT